MTPLLVDEVKERQISSLLARIATLEHERDAAGNPVAYPIRRHYRPRRSTWMTRNPVHRGHEQLDQGEEEEEEEDEEDPRISALRYSI